MSKHPATPADVVENIIVSKRSTAAKVAEIVALMDQAAAAALEAMATAGEQHFDDTQCTSQHETYTHALRSRAQHLRNR